MNDLLRQGIRNVILTSGTLSPLESFAAELKMYVHTLFYLHILHILLNIMLNRRSPFHVQLENKHVIDASQIWVGVICRGPSNYPLNSSFKTREKEDYKSALGNSLGNPLFFFIFFFFLVLYLGSYSLPPIIVNFARIVPDGLLVFFPSYSVLSTCIDGLKVPVL